MNIARIIYDYFPDSDMLPIDPEVDCKDLKTLYDKITGMGTSELGDNLFRCIVVEVYEAGQLQSGSIDKDLVIHCLCRLEDDLSQVINAIDNG